MNRTAGHKVTSLTAVDRASRFNRRDRHCQFPLWPGSIAARLSWRYRAGLSRTRKTVRHTGHQLTRSPPQSPEISLNLYGGTPNGRRWEAFKKKKKVLFPHSALVLLFTSIHINSVLCVTSPAHGRLCPIPVLIPQRQMDRTPEGRVRARVDEDTFFLSLFLESCRTAHDRTVNSVHEWSGRWESD